MNQVVQAEQEYALIIEQTASPPQVVLAYLRMLLNYLYGLEVLSAAKMTEVASIVLERGESLRTIFLFQDSEITSKNAVSVLSRRGEIPVFVLMPKALLASHQDWLVAMPNVFPCPFEGAVTQADPSLQSIVGDVYEEAGIAKLPVDVEGTPHELVQKRVEQRLKYLDTLPTLPEIVVQISRLLADEKTTAEDLEEILVSDPAIAHRLLHVVGSSAVSGTRDSDTWSLREAIVRLGLKQVGAIAQQIKLINGLVRPERSKFDLTRFWSHSVATAYIADQLYERKLVTIEAEIPFDRYWLAALLHDVGKLVLGYFAWEYFSDIIASQEHHKTAFRREEERLDHLLTHEYLGRLMLLNANAPRAVVEAAATHNTPPGQPRPVVSLVHVANNLAKELGFGYLPEEGARYSTSVLVSLGLKRRQMGELRGALGETVAADVEDIVARCMNGG